MNILTRLFKRKPPRGCEWEDSCNCKTLNKPLYCEKCKWYWFIDSGYGYCKALPEHIPIAWCRDICSLFVGKPEHSD